MKIIWKNENYFFGYALFYDLFIASNGVQRACMPWECALGEAKIKKYYTN